MFAFKGWIKKKRHLKVKDVVLVETKSKTGKGSYHMAQVIQVHPDTSGLIRMVTLEARPQGGPFSPQYYHP